MFEAGNAKVSESWLATRSRSEIIAIASRSALRALPHIISVGERLTLLFPALRANLICVVASKWLGADIRKAARAAIKAQNIDWATTPTPHQGRDAAANHAANRALESVTAPSRDKAARCADGAQYAGQYTAELMALETLGNNDDDINNLKHYSELYYAAGSVDAAALRLGLSADMLFSRGLWPDRPNWADEVYILFFAALAKERAFTFWLRWFQSLVEGQPQNWDLLREIALIDPADWDAGPERVAERIAEIEAWFLRDTTGLAERVSLDAETGLLRVDPIPVEDAPLLGALLGQVDTMLDLVLGAPSNGLAERAFVPRLLRATLTRHANDPQRIEMNMVTAANSLRRELHETEDLPRSEDNLALLDAVEECGRGVRAAHPEVAAARERLAAQALKELPEADRAKLEAATPNLVAASTGTMREDFAADLPVLVASRDAPADHDAPPVRPADAAARVFSRSATSWELLRASGEALSRLEARTGMKRHETIGMFLTVVGIGLSIYGIL